jgi:APA family basic amino acid/polyamine antiporter
MNQFQQRLRLFDSTTLVVGSMIGSGIFLALPIMAQAVPSHGILLGQWIFDRLFTLLGANCCAELAAMLPITVNFSRCFNVTFSSPLLLVLYRLNGFYR